MGKKVNTETVSTRKTMTALTKAINTMDMMESTRKKSTMERRERTITRAKMGKIKSVDLILMESMGSRKESIQRVACQMMKKGTRIRERTIIRFRTRLSTTEI